MSPTEYYHKLIESDQIIKDPQQERVIEQFQRIYDLLVSRENQTNFLHKFIGKRKSSIKGLYLYGQVGIGKTFLMDCFYYCIPFKNKLRIHFHAFMRMIHEKLRALKHEQNPLKKIAKEIAKDSRLICFDELIVNDITDAMLLAGLFKSFYNEGISLIFTSNCAPDDLYLKGIQRESFLPAIELIKKNSNVIHLLSIEDYRLKRFEENNFYYWPLTAQADQMLQAQFELINKSKNWDQQPIVIHDRRIAVQRKGHGVIWFDFLDICGVPRSQHDYLHLVKDYHTIIVSNLKVIQPEQNDLVRSFINLVDVLYDSRRRLILSAEKPIEQIYLCGRLLFEFARTRSRIIEMQTAGWQEKCRL